MNYKDWIGVGAGIVSFFGFVPYIWTMCKGRTRPSRASWFSWSIVGLMLLLSYYYSGAGETIFVPIGYFLGPFIVFLFAIKLGEGGLNIFDASCITIAIASFVVWIISKSPILALKLGLFAHFIGALPTIRKSYYEPRKENRFAWLIFEIGNAINIIAIKEITFAKTIYLFYMFVFTGMIVILVFRSTKTSPP